jgi:hypothetical protein
MYKQFVDWLDYSCSKPESATVPKVALDKVANAEAASEKMSQQSSQQKQTPRGLQDSGMHSYKERRDQHKSKIAGG